MRATRDVRLFAEVIRRSRPDLVVVVTTMLPAALIAARREGVPAVVYASELHRASDSAVRRMAGSGLMRLTERLASSVIACSSTAAAQFRGSRTGDGRTPVKTIYPPIADVYTGGDGAAFRRRYGIDPNARCIVAVGNVTRPRGQDVLIEALARIRPMFPDVCCALVGSTFARPKDVAFETSLRELARDRGVADAVVFSGEEPQIADAYAAAAVVVNPARTHPESFGRVACEALAAGRPVISTRVGAVPEVLGAVPGALLVPPGDPASLASAVIGVLRDPELAGEQAQKGGKEVLRRFAPDRSLEAFQQVVEGAAAVHSHPFG
jgi:glycosyltransferase involved in cell wall biosynthesis